MTGKRLLLKSYYIVLAILLMGIAYVVWHFLFSYESDTANIAPISTNVSNGETSIPVEVPAMTIDDTSALLRWTRVEGIPQLHGYAIYVNGQLYKTIDYDGSKGSAFIGRNTQFKDVQGSPTFKGGPIQTTAIMLEGLKPRENYEVEVRALDGKGESLHLVGTTTFKTSGTVPTITLSSMGVYPDSTVVQTEKIQKAINETPIGAKLVIPRGVYRTGALFLHSYMTLELAEGAILQGSDDSRDFVDTHSVVTGGTHYLGILNITGKDGYPLEGVRIIGSGIIDGNGWEEGTRLAIGQEWNKVLREELPGQEGKDYHLTREDWFKEAHQLLETSLKKGRLAQHEVVDAMSRGANLYRAFTTRSHAINVKDTNSLYMRGIYIRNSPSDAVHIENSEDIILWDMGIQGNYSGSGISVEGKNVWIGGLYMQQVLHGIELIDSNKTEYGVENIVVTNLGLLDIGDAIHTRNSGTNWIKGISLGDTIIIDGDALLTSASTKVAEGGIRQITVNHVWAHNVQNGLYLISYDSDIVTPRLYNRPNLLLVDYIGEERSYSIYRDITVKDSIWSHMDGRSIFIQGTDKGRHKNIIIKDSFIEAKETPYIRFGDNVRIQ